MGRRHNAAAAALIAVPTALLAGMSFLSARAAFIALPAEAILEEARVGRQPSPDGLRRAADLALEAAGAVESARYRTAAASAMVAANHAGALEDGRVEQAIRGALAVSPASPFNWSRLAWLRYRARDTKGAAAAWQMSVLTGRYKPPIMISRIDLGLRLLNGQDRAFEDAVRDQILVAARTDASGLAALAIARGSQPIMRAAIASDTEARKGYEAANKAVVQRIISEIKKRRP